MDSCFVYTTVVYSVSSWIRWKTTVRLENRDFVTIIQSFVLNGSWKIGGGGVLASNPSTVFNSWSTTNPTRLDDSSSPSFQPQLPYKDNTSENEPAAMESNARRRFVVTTQMEENEKKSRFFRLRREKSRRPSLTHGQKKRMPGHIGTCRRCRHVPPSNDSAFSTMTERLFGPRRPTDACEMYARTDERPRNSFYIIA